VCSVNVGSSRPISKTCFRPLLRGRRETTSSPNPQATPELTPRRDSVPDCSDLDKRHPALLRTREALRSPDLGARFYGRLVPGANRTGCNLAGVPRHVHESLVCETEHFEQYPQINGGRTEVPAALRPAWRLRTDTRSVIEMCRHPRLCAGLPSPGKSPRIKGFCPTPGDLQYSEHTSATHCGIHTLMAAATHRVHRAPR